MGDLVLGIDTSTRVAVGLSDGERVLVSRLVGDTRSHVELLAPAVADVLAEAGVTTGALTRIGVGVGPGPFTGLRVGIATARVLGEALGVPVTGVCGLDVVALQMSGRAGGPFAVVADARRHEVYWALYDASGLRTSGPFVGAPAGLPPGPVFGPGLETYPALGGPPEAVDAGFLAANLGRLPDVGLTPLYLRQPDAEVAGTRKSTLGARGAR